MNNLKSSLDTKLIQTSLSQYIQKTIKISFTNCAYELDAHYEGWTSYTSLGDSGHMNKFKNAQ